MESKKEPKPEVIFIKMEKLAADNNNGSAIIKTEKLRADDKQGHPKIEVTDKKKAAIIKTEASANENIVPAAAVKKEKQTKPQAPIKRKAAPTSNNESNVTKVAKKLTQCCHQETCEYQR
jgi:hypothetical protein